MLFLGLTLSLSFMSQRKVVEKGAFGSGSLELKASKASPAVGEEFNVEVWSHTGTSKVTVVELEINYDQSKIQVVSGQTASAGPKFSVTGFSDNQSGKLSIVLYNDKVLGGTGAITEADLAGGDARLVTFKTKGKAAGTTSLSFGSSSRVMGYNVGSLDVIINVTKSAQLALTITSGGAPAATPTPGSGGATPTPVPTGGVPPSGTPILNFKVKFQGITEKRGDQAVTIFVTQGDFAKSYYNITVTSDNDGIYSGRTTLSPNIDGRGFAAGPVVISIKGPRHLTKRFCKANQAAGYRCGPVEVLALSAGENTFDFSKVVLEGGDLPNPNEDYKQDGVVNSVDWSLMNSRLGSTSADDLRVADINMDGVVNATDRLLLRNTLETKYGEWE